MFGTLLYDTFCKLCDVWRGLKHSHNDVIFSKIVWRCPLRKDSSYLILKKTVFHDFYVDSKLNSVEYTLSYECLPERLMSDFFISTRTNRFGFPEDEQWRSRKHFMKLTTVNTCNTDFNYWLSPYCRFSHTLK